VWRLFFCILGYLRYRKIVKVLTRMVTLDSTRLSNGVREWG
jgi:hypothetical protein